MNRFENKSQQTIIQNIIDCFKEGSKSNYFASSDKTKRKIVVKRHLEKLKKENHIIVLEQYHPNTQKWEFVFADITAIMKGYKIKILNENDYKYIGFDIIFSLEEGFVYKRFFIRFSYHALERFIERCNLKELSTADKVKKFISSMIKPIILRCLSMYEQLYIDIKNSSKNNIKEIFNTRESYVVINDIFMPIAFEIANNQKGEICFSFTIKTIMPSDFNGAQKTINEKELSNLKQNIFEYIDIVRPLISNCNKI